MPSLWASGVRETSVNIRDFALNFMKNSIPTWKAKPKLLPKSLWALCLTFGLWAFGPLGTQVGAENTERKTRRFHGLLSTIHFQDPATKCGFCLRQDSIIRTSNPTSPLGSGGFSVVYLFSTHLLFKPVGR